MNRDFLELLGALSARDARYLIVGAYALAVHGRPRATGDLDVWIEPTPENAARVFAALQDFGAPLAGLTEADLSTPGVVFQMGRPPRRIDILTQASGLEFGAAWRNRVVEKFGSEDRPFIGLADQITNKRATGRPKDVEDARALSLIRDRGRGDEGTKE